MSNKKQLIEMRRRKAALEAKLKSIRESRSKSGLAYLIESELEKAEVVLAAKGVVEKISKMAEDAAKIMGDDVMPLMDTLKATYGPQMADTFQKSANATIQQLTQSLTQAKDSLSAEIGKFESALGGGDGSDMANYNDDSAMAGGTEPDTSGFNDAASTMADAGAGGADAGADFAAPPADMDDAGDDALAGSEDDLFADEPETAGPATGRARKESAQRRGKAIQEGLLDSMKSYLGSMASKAPAQGSPRERLEALKPFLTAEDYEVVAQFPDQLLKLIFDSLDQSNATAVAPMGAMGAPMGAMAPATDMSIAQAPDAPMMGDLDGSMQDELGDVGLDDEMGDDLGDELGMAAMPMESLRESKNPDRVIFNAFRKSLTEGLSPVKAAKKVAEKFSIDFADVVQIIKENAKCDKNAKKPAKKDSKKPSFLKKKVKEGSDPYSTSPFEHDARGARPAQNRKAPVSVGINGQNPGKDFKNPDLGKAKKEREDAKARVSAKRADRANPKTEEVKPSKGKPSFKPAGTEKAETLNKPGARDDASTDIKPSKRLASKIDAFKKQLGDMDHGQSKKEGQKPWQKGSTDSRGSSVSHAQAPVTLMSKQVPVGEAYQNGNDSSFQNSNQTSTTKPGMSTTAPSPSPGQSAPAASSQMTTGNSGTAASQGTGNSAAPPNTAQQQQANTPSNQVPVPPQPSPNDLTKAKTLADKLRGNPNMKVDDLSNEISKNITSIGKTNKDVPQFTDLVGQELKARGALK